MIVRIAEVPGLRSQPSPCLDELAVTRILHDARAVGFVTGMAIGHEDIAVGRNGNARRPIERVRPVSADACRADRHQHFPVRTDLQDLLAHRDALRVFRGHAEDRLLVVRIRRPDVPVFVDGESVRMREQSHAEALEKLARRIELQNRRVGVSPIDARGVAVGLIVETAVKHPDVAVRRHVHPDDLSPLASIRTLHACGKRRPIRRETIRIWKIGFGGARRAWSLRSCDRCERQHKESLDEKPRAVAMWFCHGKPVLRRNISWPGGRFMILPFLTHEGGSDERVTCFEVDVLRPLGCARRRLRKSRARSGWRRRGTAAARCEEDATAAGRNGCSSRRSSATRRRKASTCTAIDSARTRRAVLITTTRIGGAWSSRERGTRAKAMSSGLTRWCRSRQAASCSIPPACITTTARWTIARSSFS